MRISDMLRGKIALIPTDMRVSVELEIKEVKDTSYSYDTGPSTPENDWWPDSVNVQQYTVYFVNGSTKTYSSLDQIVIKE